jgi:hypothetical protein
MDAIKRKAEARREKQRREHGRDQAQGYDDDFDI